MNDGGFVISIPNSFLFLWSVAVFIFLQVSVIQDLGHLPPRPWMAAIFIFGAQSKHDGVSAAVRLRLTHPSLAKPPFVFLLFFFLSTSDDSWRSCETTTWAPGLVQAFPRSPEEPATIFLPHPPSARWRSAVLPGGPGRGQWGLLCKWEPSWRYLLFHLYLLSALGGREATDI